MRKEIGSKFKGVPYMFRLVYAVWFIIVGGWIIFFDGRQPQCIVCRDGILTIMAVICILFGIMGIVDHFRNPSANLRGGP